MNSLNFRGRNFSLYTAKEKRDLFEEGIEITEDRWPLFLKLSSGTIDYPTDYNVEDFFPETQFVILNEDQEIVSVVETVPIYCPEISPDFLKDKGCDWAKYQARQRESLVQRNCLCALSASIPTNQKGNNYGELALMGMHQIAKNLGLKTLIAPVRPHSFAKSQLSFEDFIKEDSDPWIKTHQALGATIIIPALRSQCMRLKELELIENLQDLKRPDGALVDLVRENGELFYIEPNVWMKHTIS